MGVKPRVLLTQGKCSTAELHPQLLLTGFSMMGSTVLLYALLAFIAMTMSFVFQSVMFFIGLQVLIQP